MNVLYSSEITEDSALAEATPHKSGSAILPSIGMRAAPISARQAMEIFSCFQAQKLNPEDLAAIALDVADTNPRVHQKSQEINEQTLARVNGLATDLHNQGNLLAAEELLRQTLLLFKQHFGETHPQTLRAQNSLACLLQRQGSLVLARQLYLQTLEKQRHLLGATHLDAVTTLENFATLLYEQHEFEQAAILLHETRQIRRYLLGDAHVDTLRSCNNLALLLQKQGKLVPAEKLLRQTWRAQCLVLGEQHAETLTTLNNLAIVLADLGQSAAAESTHRQCLLLSTKSLGESHPDTLNSQYNLAIFWLRQRRFAQALPVLLNTYTLANRIFVADHFFKGRVAMHCGACLTALQQFDEAEKYLLIGYSQLKNLLGEAHTETQRARRKIIKLYDLWGKPASSQPYRKVVLSYS